MEIFDSCKVGGGGEWGGGGISFSVFKYTATSDILWVYHFLKFNVFNVYYSCINKSKYLDIPCFLGSVSFLKYS